MIKLTGDEHAKAIKQWMTSDIAKSPNLRNDLGRFFFSIATMSMGFFTGFVKIDKISIHTSAVLMYVFSFLSLLIAVKMVIPEIRQLSGKDDLRELYIHYNKKSLYFILSWLVIWFASVVCGIFALFWMAG